MKWISLNKYLSDSGYTVSQFNNWKRRLKHPIKAGTHYVSGNNSCSVNVMEMDEWWQEGGPHVSATVTVARGSGSKIEAGSSSTGRSTSTSIQKVASPLRSG